MSRKKPTHKDLLPLCSDLGPEDGLDPRLAARRPLDRGPNRKALQLCGQVARTLAGALAECGDEVLRDLLVASVTPAPNSSHLLVTVTPAAWAGNIEAADVLSRLQRALPWLRLEVAAIVCRRKVPDLAFRLRT